MLFFHCVFRLLESHKKLQKLNHELEDKLINVVRKSVWVISWYYQCTPI